MRFSLRESDSVRARVREYMNPPPCVSACESKFVCPTCRLESVCVCVCVCVCVLYVAEARIFPLLVLALGLCSADLSGSRRASQLDFHALPASSVFDLVSACFTYPFSHTLHCLYMIFLATCVYVFFPHSIFAELFRSPMYVLT